MRRKDPSLGCIPSLLPTPRATDDWGRYTDAIRRWEALTRPAPTPVQEGRGGKSVLAPAFAEWVMGWDPGTATDPALGLSRAKQLMVIGNGVVPAAGAEAISQLVPRLLSR
jgi:DNA (cytosine-5)-methyltransferase 1